MFGGQRDVVSEAAHVLRQFAHFAVLERNLGQGTAEIEDGWTHVDAGARIESQVSENLVRGRRPVLGALERGRIAVMSAHCWRPLPQRPSDNGSDFGSDSICDDHDLVASPSSLQRNRQTDDTGTDYNDALISGRGRERHRGTPGSSHRQGDMVYGRAALLDAGLAGSIAARRKSRNPGTAKE